MKRCSGKSDERFKAGMDLTRCSHRAGDTAGLESDEPLSIGAPGDATADNRSAGGAGLVRSPVSFSGVQTLNMRRVSSLIHANEPNMRHFHRFTHRTLTCRSAAFWGGIVLVLAGCDQDPVGPEGQATYQVTEGACGEVHFVEKLGTDLATAIGVLEGRKAEQFGVGQVTLETFRLQVADRDGAAPEAEFYAVRVVDTDTQLLAHSVVEVVTTEGDLFSLEWCPD